MSRSDNEIAEIVAEIAGPRDLGQARYASETRGPPRCHRTPHRGDDEKPEDGKSDPVAACFYHRRKGNYGERRAAHHRDHQRIEQHAGQQFVAGDRRDQLVVMLGARRAEGNLRRPNDVYLGSSGPSALLTAKDLPHDDPLRSLRAAVGTDVRLHQTTWRIHQLHAVRVLGKILVTIICFESLHRGGAVNS